jgi:hypothetical protein
MLRSELLEQHIEIETPSRLLRGHAEEAEALATHAESPKLV